MKKISKILCKFLACSFALTSNLQVSNIKVSAIFNINERLKEIQDEEYKEVDDALDEIDINHFKQKKLSTIHCEYIKDIRSYKFYSKPNCNCFSFVECYNYFPTYLVRYFLDQNIKEKEKLQIMTKIFDVNIDVILKILSFVPINTSEHSKLINKFKYFSEKLNDKKLSSNDKERCKNESKEFINDMETIVKLHNKWLD